MKFQFEWKMLNSVERDRLFVQIITAYFINSPVVYAYMERYPYCYTFFSTDINRNSYDENRNNQIRGLKLDFDYNQ